MVDDAGEVACPGERAFACSEVVAIADGLKGATDVAGSVAGGGNGRLERITVKGPTGAVEGPGYVVRPVADLAKGVLKVVDSSPAEVADEVADESTGFGEGAVGLHPGLTLRLLSRSLALSLLFLAILWMARARNCTGTLTRNGQENSGQ